MSQPAPRSVLTLGDQRTIARAHAVLLEARRRVALENRLAAGSPNLSHSDPCWQLASEVSLALDGDVLAPATRRQLLERAGCLGVRQFDANLLIALVQDRARRGETIEAGSNPIALINQRVAPRLADPMPFVLFAMAIGLAIATVITVTQWLGV